MIRGWLGVGILVCFLMLGLITSSAMDSAHLPTCEMLDQAADKTLRGDFDGGVALTNSALRESASTGETSWYSEANIDRDLSIALGCLAGSSLVAAIASAAIVTNSVPAKIIKKNSPCLSQGLFLCLSAAGRTAIIIRQIITAAKTAAAA